MELKQVKHLQNQETDGYGRDKRTEVERLKQEGHDNN